MPTMTASKPTRKQTAANNAFLANVKRAFNKPLYAMALELVNGPDGPEAGEVAMRAYLLRNVVTELDF
jgi:hypothetical protein